MRKFREKYFGDAAFYRMVFAVAIPIMIQNGITNFVNLLDNIMIGQIGTESMTGVSIVNQILFVYNLCVFGAVSGAGIFTAQYYGQNNTDGIRHTFRFKMLAVAAITLLTVLLCLFQGRYLINLYLTGEGSAASIDASLASGLEYMVLMLTGLPFFMITQVYGSTLKECGQTLLPMKAGVVAICINLLFNYLLIYGKFGFPMLGVKGAAIATVLSRVIEAAIIVFATHKDAEKNPFVVGLYRSLAVPADVTKRIAVKGTPLLLNETLWAAGMATLAACYSLKGLNVVAALNISNTICNLFHISFVAMGEAVAIIIGQILGMGDMKRARETDTKIIVFAVLLCTCVAVVMFVTAPLFPDFYNTTEDIKQLAAKLIMISALFVPQHALLNSLYFTLRSGGKTMIAFFFDSVFIWCVSVVFAFALAKLTTLPILWIYFLVQLADAIKAMIGLIFVKKGVWLQNIVE
ncbi:MATE family efflux transporter [bacterium 1XD8-76]|nr:MATE family efflux transporter [bacterium 1XD8-76]